jgi:drug/metabolite transporter (DMT)-like permease
MPADHPGQQHGDRVVLGMAAAAGAFFMFAVMNLFAKLLSEHHSVIEIAFWRNLISSVPFLIAIFVFGRRDILVVRAKPALIGIRAILGWVSLVLTFTAFSLMPMADTTVLLFTSTLFVPVLGVILLKESVGPYRWTAIVIGFVGVAIMAHPSGQMHTWGILVAICAALLQAAMQILLRYLTAYERTVTITFYFFVIGTFLSALPLPFVAVRPTLAEVPLLIGVGVSGAAAQWMLTVAFRNVKAVIATVFNYSGIVWATLFGWLVWYDFPAPVVLIGAAVVIASNLLVVWRESRLGKI